MRKRTSPIWTYSKEELTRLVKNSNSLSSILRGMGIVPSVSGSRFRSLKTRLNEDNIDYSHIKLGCFSNIGRDFSIKIKPLEEIMVEHSTYDRKNLKARLFKEGILENKCAICELLPEWENKKLVMVLDHINGINNDNRLENLRLLCPNCNSQTLTFSGRKNKKPIPKCKKCNNNISRRSKSGLCQSCYGLLYVPRKVKNRPSKEQLLQEVKETSYCAVGRKYGVSYSCIIKWIKMNVRL